jgi:hypothetical protein
LWAYVLWSWFSGECKIISILLGFPVRVTLLLSLLVSTLLFSVRADAAPRNQLMMKGVELYSWRNRKTGLWRFSLLPGTNRNKSLTEITEKEATVADLSTLKKRLAILAKGESVFWSLPYSSLSYPPVSMVDEIVKYAAARHLRLFINK